MLSRLFNLPIAAMLPDIQEGGNDDLYPWRGRTITFALVVGVCISYVLSRFIATAGRVSLDQVEYWLLALVPVLVLTATARAISKSANASPISRERDSKFYVCCWLSSLVCFLFFRTTLISEHFEFPIYRLVAFQPFLSYLLLSCIYTLLGYGLALAVSTMPRNKKILWRPNSWGGIAFTAILNSVMFDIMVFGHTF